MDLKLRCLPVWIDFISFVKLSYYKWKRKLQPKYGNWYPLRFSELHLCQQLKNQHQGKNTPSKEVVGLQAERKWKIVTSHFYFKQLRQKQSFLKEKKWMVAAKQKMKALKIESKKRAEIFLFQAIQLNRKLFYFFLLIFFLAFRRK